MNEYTLSYTGAQVDEILTKAQTDVSAQEDQPLSPEAQQIVRNNINAATKDIEPTVAQLRGEVTSLNTDVTNLNSDITEINEHLESLDEVRDVTIPQINEVLETLEYTAEEYLFLASYLAYDFDPTVVYDKGDFVRYNGNIYERKEDAEVPGYWKANEWIYLGDDRKKPINDLGLILRPFVTESTDGNPCIKDGLIFTVTQYNTIVVNGEIPANTEITYILMQDEAFLIESDKTYRVSGCPRVSGNNFISMRASVYGVEIIYTFDDIGFGNTFTGSQIIGPTEDDYYPVISIYANNQTEEPIVCDNLVFSPSFISY